ncbi:MAG: hypothetical protein WDZ41_03785 [Candidatus Babeliales bacterium]
MKFTWSVIFVVLSSSLITWAMKGMEDRRQLDRATSFEQYCLALQKISNPSKSSTIVPPLTSQITPQNPDKSASTDDLEKTPSTYIKFTSSNNMFSDGEQKELNTAFQNLKILKKQDEEYTHECDVDDLMKSLSKNSLNQENPIQTICTQCEKYKNQLDIAQQQKSQSFSNKAENMQNLENHLKKEYENKIARLHKTYFSISTCLGFGLLYFATPALGKIIQGFLNSK